MKQIHRILQSNTDFQGLLDQIFGFLLKIIFYDLFNTSGVFNGTGFFDYKLGNTATSLLKFWIELGKT